MTIRRTAALAIGAFALIALAKPPRPVGNLWVTMNWPSTRSDSTRRTLVAAEDSLRLLRSAVRSREVRSTATRLLAQMPTAARDQLVADARIAPSLRALLQAVYTTSRARMPVSPAGLPLLVLLDSAGDSPNSIQWIESVGPSSPACVTVVRLNTSLRILRDASALTREVHRRLGPQFPQPVDFGLCGFEASFGQPSPVVRQWLRDRGWLSVRAGLDPLHTLTPAGRAYYDATWNSGDNGAFLMSLRGCSAGRPTTCVGAVAPLLLRPSVEVASNSAEAGTSGYWWSWRGSPDLMNALATSMGPQRFAELWHADEAPPDAYRRITGVSMDTLAQRLLVGDRGPRRAAASVSLGELIVALLVAAFFAGIATLSHPRNRRS